MENKKSLFSNFLVCLIPRNHVMLPKILQCLPNVFEIESQILSVTCNILGCGLCLHFSLHLTPLSLSLTRFQPHRPSFCFSNTPSSFLPQELCRYSSLFPEWSQSTASQFSYQPPQPYFSLPPSKGCAQSLLPSKSIPVPISLSLRKIFLYCANQNL